MNDHNASADFQVQGSSRFSPIAIVLILTALVGGVVSTVYSRKVSSLLRQQREFHELFGELKIEDPSAVAIVAVKPTAKGLPAWLDPENTWIFRIRVPANYEVSFSTNSGLIAADSPLSTAGGSYSSYGVNPEAEEFQIVVSTSNESGRKRVHLRTKSGSRILPLPKELERGSSDKWVLDTVVAPGDAMKTFAADEAICIWKLRSKTPSKKRLKGTELYPGCEIYLYDKGRHDAFKRWKRGETSSMEDLIQSKKVAK